jgi:hypothetical protein
LTIEKDVLIKFLENNEEDFHPDIDEKDDDELGGLAGVLSGTRRGIRIKGSSHSKDIIL